MSTPPEFRSALIEGRSEDGLREKLFRMKATDGLPVVLPTPERVEAMLEAADIAGFDRDLVLGEIGPNMGEATVEKVAINAVMAGCLPEHLPVVIAAIQALADPRMDASEFQVTTHPCAPLLIVSGPAVEEVKIACGFGALGYGQRANLCIGRAVRLCLINFGGVWPGESAMSIMSQPATLAFCLGEDQASSPFPPLHTSFGFAEDASVLTAVCVGGPMSVICPPGADWPERILTVLAHSMSALGNNNATGSNGTVVVVLNPDHAHVLAQAGFNRASIATELAKRAGNPAGLVARLHGYPPPADPEKFFPAIRGPEKVLVLVAGGSGIYSTIMVPWGGGPHGGVPVSREIVFADFCEV